MSNKTNLLFPVSHLAVIQIGVKKRSQGVIKCDKLVHFSLT